MKRKLILNRIRATKCTCTCKVKNIVNASHDVERLPDELLHGGGPADVPAAPAGDAGLQSDQTVAAHQVAVAADRN